MISNPGINFGICELCDLKLVSTKITETLTTTVCYIFDMISNWMVCFGLNGKVFDLSLHARYEKLYALSWLQHQLLQCCELSLRDCCMVKPLDSSGPRTKERVDHQTYLTHESVLSDHFSEIPKRRPLLHIDEIASIIFQKNQAEDKNFYSAEF